MTKINPFLAWKCGKCLRSNGYTAQECRNCTGGFVLYGKPFHKRCVSCQKSFHHTKFKRKNKRGVQVSSTVCNECFLSKEKIENV